MVIVYNCDDKFSEIFAVSVVSLFENNRDIDKITVYLIGNGISEKNRGRIGEIAETYGREIIIVPMLDLKKATGKDISIPQGYDLANYGILFTASRLPQDIDKVIYVDCDTIFAGSLRELWETDISGHYAGMVNDIRGASHRKLLGIPGKGKYYNSGLLLINLKKWREEYIEQKFIDYIAEQGGYVPIVDEGVLNAVLDGKILCLPLKYNVATMMYAFSYREFLKIGRPYEYYSEEEAKEACEHPVTVHFTNNFYMPIRPWMEGCVHPYREKYIEYRSLTPWKNEPLWKDNRSKIKKAYSSFCHKLPRGIVVSMSELVRVDLVPLMHRYKKWKHCRINRGGYVERIIFLYNGFMDDLYACPSCAAERMVA